MDNTEFRRHRLEIPARSMLLGPIRVKQEMEEIEIEFLDQDFDWSESETPQNSQVAEQAVKRDRILEPVRVFASPPAQRVEEGAQDRCTIRVTPETNSRLTEMLLAPNRRIKAERVRQTINAGVSAQKQFPKKSHLVLLEQNNTKCMQIQKVYYECNICKKVFTTKASINEHSHVHMSNKPTIFIHKTAVKPASRLKNPPTKERGPPDTSNDRPFLCDICNRQFTQNCHLMAHKRFHTEAKPFSCDICNKLFAKQSYLDTHLRIKHEGEEPFVCDNCNESFVTKRDLFIHKRVVHLVKRPYSCDICNSTFINTGYLVRHKRTIHSDDPSFICDICDKPFSSKRYFMEHRRVHTGERPFACDLCNKRYNAKRSLTKHKESHIELDPLNASDIAEAELEPCT